MNTMPTVHKIEDLQDRFVAALASGEGVAADIGHRYVLARFSGWMAWAPIKRLKIAYKVFMGHYDALDWQQGTPKAY